MLFEKKAPGAANGVPKVESQLLALPLIRSLGADAGELVGFINLLARRVRVAQAHVLGASDGREDLVRGDGLRAVAALYDG